MVPAVFFITDAKVTSIAFHLSPPEPRGDSQAVSS